MWTKEEIKDNFYLQSIVGSLTFGKILALDAVSKVVRNFGRLGLKYYAKYKEEQRNSLIFEQKFKACLKQNHKMKLELKELRK